MVTTHLGPDQIVAALSAEFEDEFTAPQIEDAVKQLERTLRTAHPQISTLFVKLHYYGLI